MGYYNKKGRPGDLLSLPNIEIMVSMIFSGQDSFSLVQSDGKQYLQNTVDERELPSDTDWELSVEASTKRCMLKEKGNSRLNAPKLYCDCLLGAKVDVKPVTLESILSTPAFQQFLPEAYGNFQKEKLREFEGFGNLTPGLSNLSTRTPSEPASSKAAGLPLPGSTEKAKYEELEKQMNDLKEKLATAGQGLRCPESWPCSFHVLLLHVRQRKAGRRASHEQRPPRFKSEPVQRWPRLFNFPSHVKSLRRCQAQAGRHSFRQRGGGWH